MRAAAFVCFLVPAACLGACAFLTDFPEIDTVQAGAGGAGGATSTTTGMTTSTGSNGVGGEGGAPPCEACRNCFPSNEACPSMSDSFVLESVAMGTPTSQTRLVRVTDAVVDGSSGFLLVGTFGSSIVDPNLEGGANIQSGFLLPGDQGQAVGFTTCLDDTTTYNDEVFMTSMAKQPGDPVVTLGGGFEGVHLVSHAGVPDCATQKVIDGHAAAPELVPFLLWVNPEDGSASAKLEPTISGTSFVSNGYVSDVAILPASSRVVAVGIAEGNPFDGVTGGPTGYYAISSDTGTNNNFLQLDGVACDIIQDQTALWGLRSSIAADPNGDAWVVAAGCGAGDGTSGLWRLTVEAGGNLVEAGFADWGSPQDPLIATEIAISATNVVIAGSYEGTPNPSWASVPGFEPGDAGDAFVMAFPLVDGMGNRWNNTTPPSWFRRIRSDGSSNVDATVEALIVGDGAVWASGVIAAEGGIGNNAGCYTTPALEAGRAFLAELEENTGTVHFVRIDGFDTEGTAGEYPLAWGTALAHPPGQLISAVSSLGDIKLECTAGTTNDPNTPRATVRVFGF